MKGREERYFCFSLSTLITYHNTVYVGLPQMLQFTQVVVLLGHHYLMDDRRTIAYRDPGRKGNGPDPCVERGVCCDESPTERMTRKSSDSLA